jgi:hypothetical protein
MVVDWENLAELDPRIGLGLDQIVSVPTWLRTPPPDDATNEHLRTVCLGVEHLGIFLVIQPKNRVVPQLCAFNRAEGNQERTGEFAPKPRGFDGLISLLDRLYHWS